MSQMYATVLNGIAIAEAKDHIKDRISQFFSNLIKFPVRRWLLSTSVVFRLFFGHQLWIWIADVSVVLSIYAHCQFDSSMQKS